MNGEPDPERIKGLIVEFLRNRADQGESTSPRHVHRRFDIPIDKAEEVMSSLTEKSIVEGFYDKEYQETRYRIK